jgi:hypothetical protein
MSIWQRLIRFFYRIVYGYVIVPVNVTQESVVKPGATALLPLEKVEGGPYVRYIMFVPRKQATGLVFHTGLSEKKYTTVKVMNSSAKSVRIRQDVHIGFLIHLF